MFGESHIEDPRPARKRFGIGRNLAGTLSRDAEEMIPAEEGHSISQHIHQYRRGQDADIKPLPSGLGLRHFDKRGLFLRIAEILSRAIRVSDVGVL